MATLIAINRCMNRCILNGFIYKIVHHERHESLHLIILIALRELRGEINGLRTVNKPYTARSFATTNSSSLYSIYQSHQTKTLAHFLRLH
jgi:hypothetical protein